jgi:hypothetical protein
VETAISAGALAVAFAALGLLATALFRLDAKMEAGFARLDSTIDSGLAQLGGRMEAGFARVDARFDRVDARLSALEIDVAHHLGHHG